jgi:glycosyltransferase involved in cell wall biosynthesis
VPICASDLPELRRFVKDNGIGDVYVMEDPAAIASAIEACRCRCVQGGLTTPALQVARDKYAWTRQGKKLMQLYETMGV